MVQVSFGDSIYSTTKIVSEGIFIRSSGGIPKIIYLWSRLFQANIRGLIRQCHLIKITNKQTKWFGTNLVIALDEVYGECLLYKKVNHFHDFSVG